MHRSVRTVVTTPVGPLIVCGNENFVTDIYFAQESDPDPMSVGLPRARAADISAPVRAALRQLDEYFAGRRRRFDLPLQLDGTPFQRAVWDFLCTIPYGQTCTYKEVAEAIGKPGAARAVGGAVGSNPVSVVVPCHRVVATGGLGGYGGGLAAKRFLLQLEGIGS